MAFLLKSSKDAVPEPFLGSGDFVGLNVSGLLYSRGGLTRTGWDAASYREMMEQILAGLVRRTQLPVVLIPHVSVDGEPWYEDDVRASRDLVERSEPNTKTRTHIVERSLSECQAKQIIARSRFFVGCRMHACIAAASEYVPVVPVSYSYKFAGVFGQLGLEDIVCNPVERPSIDEAVAHTLGQFENRQAVVEVLKTSVPRARNQALSCVKFLPD